jgi:hypothetical protein
MIKLSNAAAPAFALNQLIRLLDFRIPGVTLWLVHAWPIGFWSRSPGPHGHFNDYFSISTEQAAKQLHKAVSRIGRFYLEVK